jgi:hypothetical protein
MSAPGLRKCLYHIPGGYDNVTTGNFDGVVQALEKLAEFGNWNHSGEPPPDPPAEYADAPSLSNAAATLACGIELTGSLHNKTLPKKSRGKKKKRRKKELQLVRLRSKDLASSLLNLTSCPRRCSRVFCSESSGGSSSDGSSS